MLEWEDTDRFSFEDSDRFEEDSLCSWSSEPESLCNNWRGWKRPFGSSKKSAEDGAQVPTLSELTARCVAAHIPFELVEHVYPPVPEQLQLRIAYWSFPDNEEDIRLYSCLANGSSDEFQRGENLYRLKAVKDPLQIGFHLSASVAVPPSLPGQTRGQYNVAVTFDRRRITSCNCTCTSTAYWCSHVVSVCLHRIHLPTQVCLRAPVSESLSRLERDQLQKFAQYLISELPQQILPTAQKILDDLLSSQSSTINSVCGAPDPTAGASANDQTSWYLDEKTLHDNIKKILIKFCIPAPIVFSDVNYLSNSAPPAAAEWTSLLRPLRGREPEGMWNLLSIAREMFKRNDRNAVPLLEIITEECMACEQILVWWFNTKVALHNGSSGHSGGKHGNVNSNSHASQHACSSLCDEIVVLWRLAALNPGLSSEERELLHDQFRNWHLKIVEKVTKTRGGNVTNPQTVPGSGVNRSAISFRNDVEAFSGFKSAVEACYLDWEDYPLPSITYVSGVNRLYHCPFTCFRHGESARPDNLVNSSQAVLNCEPPMLHHDHHHHHHPRHHHKPHHHAPKRQMRINNFVEFSYMDCRHLGGQFPLCPMPIGGLPEAMRGRDGNRSSVSSEGFCENDADPDILNDTFVGSSLQGVMVDAELRECATGSESSSSGTSGIAPGEGARKKWQPGGATRVSLGGVPVPVPGGLGYYPMYEMAYPPKPASDFSLVMAPDPAAASTPREVREEPVMPPASPLALDGDSDSSGSTGSPREDREVSRRPSKDESSNSDSQQSGDEYHVYYYDPKALTCHAGNAEKLKAPEAKQDEPGSPLSSVSVFANLKKMEDPWEILFARAEGLHAHGHGREACTLAVQLAEELLANPPDLMIELPPMPTKNKRKKVNPVSHQLSCLASATLAKCAFLCTVLAENTDHSHLAFRVGLFGLEMARPPASTKPLEVKLANQETELVCLLKRIPLGPWELKVIRERAEQLKTGTLRSRGDALLPIMVASFIFEALAIPPERSPHIVTVNAAGREQRCQLQSLGLRLPTDEALGFEAAVAALGLKANVSEADHPLLCEGTRRQRGDLAIALLVYYKDEPSKIARIMEKLLDREIHMLVKVPIPTSHYSANPSAKIQLPSRRREDSVCSEPMVPSTSEPLLIDSAAVSGAGSRPHSSTSAELEQGLSALALGSAPPPGSVSQVAGIPRSKESTRYKGKRAYPSIPNQPSEAGAHFMFELAKTVLTKAGGNSSTSLFTQASTSQNHHGPHRSLHICAFQIGLYALGLHNCVSPNWLSRTYSSHVSWITGQAMEIGAPAISFLIETWEGHLTPPEAVSIADRASRGRDRNIVHAAAELALSCLPHSHALNPNEIQRAILQCKEQSDSMLEQACLTVEAAAKGGGVYPEVLFQVAKYWYELYMRNVPGGEHMDSEVPPEVMAVDSHGTLLAMVEPAQEMPPPSGAVQPVVVTTAPPPPYPSHPAVTTLAMTVPYTVGPYSFAVQGLHPHFGGPIAHRPVALPPPPHLQMYLSPPAFQYPPHAASPYLVASAPPHHMYPLPPGAAQSQGLPPPPAGSSASGSPQQVGNGLVQPVARPRQSFSQVQVRYLLAAYRVGMLALETMSRRVHDDRPQAKYARNPPYGEDAKWLLRISKKLGTQYLHQFCICAVSSIVSPFVLHDIALEAGQYLARNNPSLLGQHLRSALLPLVQKCQQMYIQCLHQKLYHLTTGDYEDFVNIVCSARAAFQITPEGSTQFKEWLQSIRSRSKSCKKDLWAQINAALQANSK